MTTQTAPGATTEPRASASGYLSWAEVAQAGRIDLSPATSAVCPCPDPIVFGHSYDRITDASATFPDCPELLAQIAACDPEPMNASPARNTR